MVFYCRSGNRSGMAAAAFREADATPTTSAGGLRAWVEQGLPLDPPDGEVAGPRPAPEPCAVQLPCARLDERQPRAPHRPRPSGREAAARHRRPTRRRPATPQASPIPSERIDGLRAWFAQLDRKLGRPYLHRRRDRGAGPGGGRRGDRPDAPAEAGRGHQGRRRRAARRSSRRVRAAPRRRPRRRSGRSTSGSPRSRRRSTGSPPTDRPPSASSRWSQDDIKELRSAGLRAGGSPGGVAQAPDGGSQASGAGTGAGTAPAASSGGVRSLPA